MKEKKMEVEKSLEQFTQEMFELARTYTVGSEEMFRRRMKSWHLLTVSKAVTASVKELSTFDALDIVKRVLKEVPEDCGDEVE